ncbi:hypothetical protein [Ketobacter alkanivorans]|uniref:DNA alkylation repair protein n=1 Tax=Ketobacter alkanivorans TaxID=1917421 RepID=A0A2K9LR57_9GAMM|nr:hypothetical protein [Ketobacter alkanivorans]AUM14730.1 hypothetical protein Kalk_20865 [Ketobacter alkanivorans]
MSFESDPYSTETRQGVNLRRKVDQLVIADVDHAYEVAKSIVHPWYRCQSLAKVAEHTNGTLLASTIKESFASALNCHDENRRVEVARWPLSVAIRRGKEDLAEFMLMECIEQLSRDRDPISTWCAVSVLHTIKGDNKLVDIFCDAFIRATSKGHGWRVERSIKNLLSDPHAAQHPKYIEHLQRRQTEIENWKNEHRVQKSS